MFRLPAILQAEKHHLNKGHAYMYYWEEGSNIPYYKACHAVELAYVFNNVDETIYTGKQADFNLSIKISNMWVNFAKTGNPSINGMEWMEYDNKQRKTLIIKKNELKIVDDPLKRQRELLSPLLKYMINPGYGNISLKLPFFKTIGHIFMSAFYTVKIKMGK